VRDYTVFHEDSSVVIPQEFLKFLKNPQNSLKFYVWLLVRRVVLSHERSVRSFVVISARCSLFNSVLIRRFWKTNWTDKSSV